MIVRPIQRMPQKLIKGYNDFRGGWNADVAPDLLKDDELDQADNCDLDPRGAVKKRKGTTVLNGSSYNAQVERLFEYKKNDGTIELLALIGTSLCSIDDTTGAKTVLKKLDDTDMGGYVWNDKFYFTGKQSGTNKYWEYDGTDVNEVTPHAGSSLTKIKKCRMFVWHPTSHRIFATGNASDRAALYYSEKDDPTYFKSTSEVYPTTGDGPVYALTLDADAVVPIYANSFWAWTGDDPAVDATWRKVPVNEGTRAPRSVALTPASLTLLSAGGLQSVSPGILDYNMVLLTGDQLVKDLTKNKVSSVIRSITDQTISCGVYDNVNNRYLLAYCDDSTLTRNNKILVYDWELKAFTRYTGLRVNDFLMRSNGDLLAATDGYIVKLNQEVYKDYDSRQISMQVKTKWYSLDKPFHIKKLVKLFLYAQQFATEESGLVTSVSTGYNTVNYGRVSLDESLVWDEAWGAAWGYSDYSAKQLACRLRGHRFQATFTNDYLNEPVTWYGLAFKYELGAAKAMKFGEQPISFDGYVFISPGLAVYVKEG
jgi:hypothetical protein